MLLLHILAASITTTILIEIQAYFQVSEKLTNYIAQWLNHLFLITACAA